MYLLLRAAGAPRVDQCGRVKAGAQQQMGMYYQAGTAEAMPTWIKVIFAMPRYTIRAMYTVHAAHVITFYNGIGTELSALAFFIALGRSFDALTDPFMGWITDNTRTSIGRRKPYLILGPITYSATILLHVSPPRNGSGADIALWFGITYLAFFLCDTAASVPYYALKYELCTDNKERTRIFMYTIIASFLGISIGVGMPAGLALDFIGMDPGNALQATMAQFCVVYTLGMWGAAAFIREPVSSKDAKPKSFAAALTRVLSTKATRYFIGSETLEYAVIYTFSTMLTFFCYYVFITPTGVPRDYRDGLVAAGLFAIIGFLFGGICPPAWDCLYKRVGKRKAWQVQSLYNGLSNLVFLLPLANNYTLMTAFVLLNAFAFGGQFLMDSTLADVIDYDQMLYGERLDGIFASTAYFVPKAVGAFASALPLTIIYSVGFVEPLKGCPGANETAAMAAMAEANVTSCSALDIRNQPQPAGVELVIRLLTGVLPSLASLLALAFKFAFYLRPEHMGDVHKTIEALTQDKTTPVPDPVTGQMITWLTNDMLTAEEVAIKDQLDIFFPWAIERMHRQEGHFRGLRDRAVRNVVIDLACIAAAVSVTVATVARGWLTDKALNIVPTMGCIFIGAGVTVSGILFPRLRTAQALHRRFQPGGEAYPKALLDRYVARFGALPESTTAGRSPKTMQVA